MKQRERLLFWLLALAALAWFWRDGPMLSPALAQNLTQARNPFAVGANEGAVGEVGAIGRWLLAEQGRFYLALREAVGQARAGGTAAFALIGVSFAYGVFHAAGPGHGKAVVASYMLANERALKRGLILSGLAALLQGLVAIALVGVAALVFGATAQRMTRAAQGVELISYGAVAALGLWLCWRKGSGLLAAWREPVVAAPASARFQCAGDNLSDELTGHIHDADCGHVHAPDPAQLGDNFSWGQALATIVAAGARPCSGAILVLVFSLAQGVFRVGVWATLAMSAGTALTTGALATTAVLAKGLALKFVGAESRRGFLLARGFEFLAALIVLFLGLALLAGLIQTGAMNG